MILDRGLPSAERERALDERAFVQAIRDLQAARAQSDIGVIALGIGAAIASACLVDLLDIDARLGDGAPAATLAIP